MPAFNSLTDDDVLAGETDNWTWNDSDSLSESATEAFIQANGGGPETVNGGGAYQQIYSIGDVGSDTLGTVASDTGSMTLQAAGETYTIIQSSWGNAAYDGNVPSFYIGGAGNDWDDVYNSFCVSEVGSDGLSGSLSSASNSYAIDDYYSNTDCLSEGWDGNGGATVNQNSADSTSSLQAAGTNSIASSGTTQSSLSIDYNSLVTATGSDTGNGVYMLGETSDPYQYTETGTFLDAVADTGWYAQTAGTTQGSYSYVSQSEDYDYLTGSDQDNGAWSSEEDSNWAPDGLTEVGSKSLAGTWTYETWGSLTSSSSTEGTLPSGDFLDDPPPPGMSGGSLLPENDTNTFLASIDDQLGSVGNYVFAESCSLRKLQPFSLGIRVSGRYDDRRHGD